MLSLTFLPSARPLKARLPHEPKSFSYMVSLLPHQNLSHEHKVFLDNVGRKITSRQVDVEDLSEEVNKEVLCTQYILMYLPIIRKSLEGVDKDFLRRGVQ